MRAYAVRFLRPRRYYSTHEGNPKLSKGEREKWEAVIGLEVHAQVWTPTKLFSASRTGFQAKPNSLVSHFDAAIPGTLPVLSEHAVDQAVLTGLALKGTVNRKSSFDRKHYVYPDLPHSFQITQNENPIISGGEVSFFIKGEETRRVVRLDRIQLEMMRWDEWRRILISFTQDSGKSTHDISPNESYVDLNRAGSALMEIVTRPDITCALHAGEFMKKLQTILRHIGTCDGNMEEGSLRCDVNVSVRRRDSPELGERCEVKNLNSVRHVMRAIDHEIERQIGCLERGAVVERETRRYDARLNETQRLRSKETLLDYRFMPEPDLPPLVLEEDYIAEIRDLLPELPDSIEDRLMEDYSLNHYDAAILASEKAASSFFFELAEKHDPKVVSNWITSELYGRLNRAGLDMAQSPVALSQMDSMLLMLKEGVISGRIARDLLTEVFEAGMKGTSIDPREFVKEKGWVQISDEDSLRRVCEEVLKEFPAEVEKYHGGREDRMMKHFVGNVMKKMKGKANPQLVNQLLADILESQKPTE